MKWASTVQRLLLILVLATMLPLAIFSAAVVLWIADLQGREARQGLTNTDRALSLAMDEQIETWRTALAALATSPALDSGDTAAFHVQAEAMVRRFGGWIAVSRPSGQQIVNTLEPPGAPLPRTPDFMLPPRLPPEGVVHDLFKDPAANRSIVAVTVPARRDGKVTHYLHFGLPTDHLEMILANQRVPAGWRAAVVDRQNRIVARSPNVPQRVGDPAPNWYVAQRADKPPPFIVAPMASGADYVVAFEPLSQAPWTIAVAAPRAALTRAWLQPLALLAGVGFLLILATAAAAIRLAARLARPMDRLAAAARTVTRGDPLPPVPATNIRELAALREAVIELSQKQILLREVNHRIKNSLQLVASSLALQDRTAPSDEARGYLREAQAHVQAIARLHERLYKEDQYETVEVFALARGVCEDIAAISTGRATLRTEIDGTAYVSVEAAGSFALIIAELVTNAIKHASRPGQVGRVDIRGYTVDGPMVVVVVSDNGPGLPPDFDLAAQKGLGLRMCLALTSQIGGGLRSLPSSRGAMFELRVPALESGPSPQSVNDSTT